MTTQVRDPKGSDRGADGKGRKASRPIRALVVLAIAGAMLVPVFSAEAAPGKLNFRAHDPAPSARNGTNHPTPRPRATPRPKATVSPTTAPTAAPTATADPTAAPTTAPTSAPIDGPTPTIAPEPTTAPTADPTTAPVVTSPPTIIDPFVTRAGTSLSLNGAPFTFAGLNVYNANGRGNCAYSLGSGSTLAAGLSTAAGTEVIRAWFFQYEAMTNGQIDWTAFDHTLAVAQAAGIHVIATLADEWGACDGITSRERLTADWYRGGYRVAPYAPGAPLSYRSWVQTVVSHYKDNPTILTWELMNEPSAPMDTTGACGDQNADAAALQVWATDVAGLVKSIDPNHLVSLGEQGSSQCGMTGTNYAALHVPGVDLCSAHDYGRPSIAMTDDIVYDLSTCNGLGLPLYVGESGMTVDEVGSASQRAAYLDSKFAGQFAAGLVGELVWDYCLDSTSSCMARSYDILPGDPTLAVIARH